MVNPVDEQTQQMEKEWEKALNTDAFENYFGKDHWTKRLKTKSWQVGITWRPSFDEEFFDIYAGRPGTTAVEYSTFLKPDFDEEVTKKQYDQEIAYMLISFDDSMFEELMLTIEATYREY